jgi:hypothetical protein
MRLCAKAVGLCNSAMKKVRGAGGSGEKLVQATGAVDFVVNYF